MAFDISNTDDRPIYVQIMDGIRRGIVLGTWREHEPLPSVRHLAVKLRVNPNTVQQAYRELERDGVVYVQRGQGTYVAARDNGTERRTLLQELAGRVLNEAYRYGFAAGEVMDALRRESERRAERENRDG